MRKKRVIKLSALALSTAVALSGVYLLPDSKVQTEAQDTQSGNTPPAPPDGTLPNGNPTDGSMPSGGSSSVTLSGANTADGKSVTYDGTGKDALVSSSSDENTVLANNGGSYTITNATINKTGDCSNNDNSNFYAVNAILAATGGSSAYISGTKLFSSSEGSNALFATGSNSKIYAKDISISTTGNSSRGLDATYEGTIIASGIDITTKGEHCGAIATDRGNGYISVENATLSTSGQGSPLIYSTGVIEADNITGEASGAQITGMEGLNTVRIRNSSLTGSAKKASEPVANGVIIYQSMSGDSSAGTANFEVSNSTLKSYITGGAMFYVTNTTANIVISNTKLDFDSSQNTLLSAGGNDGSNNWGKAGSNGGDVTLTADSQELKGDISCDGISDVSLYIVNNSKYTGGIINDTTYTGDGGTSVSLDASSVWTVTSDSLLKSLHAVPGATIQDKDGKTVTIKTTGGSTVVDGDSSITITTDTYSEDNKSLPAGKISDYTIDRSGFNKYFSGNNNSTEIKTPGKTTLTKISPAKNSVKIKWKKVKNCQGYIILRSTKKDSGYKEIANIKNSSQNTYTDKKLKKNQKYYYYIKAYTSDDDKIIYGKDSKVKGVKTKK